MSADIVVRALLAPAERSRRDELVAVVRDGATAFLRVGRALRALHDEGLYRETHDTFEAFCTETFKLSRPHAYRLLGAAQAFDAIERVSPMGDIKPDSERVLRPLAGLAPEKVVEAWGRAVELAAGGPVTHKHVKAALEGEAPATATEDVKRKRLPRHPSDGMRLAREAISKLSEIREDDTEKDQAFANVRRWLNAHDPCPAEPLPIVEEPPAEPAPEEPSGRSLLGVEVQPGTYWRSRTARDHVLVVDSVEGEAALVRYVADPGLPVKTTVSKIIEKLSLVARPSPKLKKLLPPKLTSNAALLEQVEASINARLFGKRPARRRSENSEAAR